VTHQDNSKSRQTNPTISIQKLRNQVKGSVIAPDDPGYDEARTVVSGGIDRRPAVIIRAADANDVSYAVSLARETGLDLAVKGGGHSPVGHGVCEGGIMLDMSGMKALDIDTQARTAWAEAGLTAGEYTTAAAAHGLATGFGDTASVGIGGLTLGGGVGFLARKYGLTIDDLLAADIVTADGELLRVDAERHPDLFWAIRGGGGNFGVVTRFQYRLHEVGMVVGGMMILPATPDVITSFIDAAQDAPEELTAIVNIMKAPPMPFLPAEIHGKLVLLASLCHVGDIEAGQRAIAPFRALATPIVDMLGPIPYPRIYQPEQEGFHPITLTYSMFVDSVDRRMAETILEHLQASTAMMAAMQFRVLGGAVARVPVEATAYAHRQSRIMANAAAIYMRPDETATHKAWIARFGEALGRGDGSVYVNFLGDDGEERVRSAYPGATWDRLREIKARYDPTNLFRLNQNIQPGK